MILGCQYIDTEVNEINVKKRALVLKNGEMVLIQRRLAHEPSAASLYESNQVENRVKKSLDFVPIVKSTIISMSKEMNMVVDCMGSSTLILEPTDVLNIKRKTLMVRGPAAVKSEVLFLVREANFSYTPVRLESGQKTGYVIFVLYVKALGAQKSEEKNLESASIDAVVVLLVERCAKQESSMYSDLWDERTSESSELILAARFEDGSEYDTKDDPEDAGKQVISARDIEQPDLKI